MALKNKKFFVLVILTGSEPDLPVESWSYVDYDSAMRAAMHILESDPNEKLYIMESKAVVSAHLTYVSNKINDDDGVDDCPF